MTLFLRIVDAAVDDKAQVLRSGIHDAQGPSTKIPKYQYVVVNFSILARCGKRRSGDWIGGSNGSTSSSDRAAD